MAERDSRYTYEFSHEFEEGPSGPARSYWIINGPGMASHGSPVCLHHRRHDNAPLTMQGIAIALDKAFEEGERQRARDISRLLEEIKR